MLCTHACIILNIVLIYNSLMAGAMPRVPSFRDNYSRHRWVVVQDSGITLPWPAEECLGFPSYSAFLEYKSTCFLITPSALSCYGTNPSFLVSSIDQYVATLQAQLVKWFGKILWEKMNFFTSYMDCPSPKMKSTAPWMVHCLKKCRPWSSHNVSCMLTNPHR